MKKKGQNSYKPKIARVYSKTSSKNDESSKCAPLRESSLRSDSLRFAIIWAQNSKIAIFCPALGGGVQALADVRIEIFCCCLFSIFIDFFQLFVQFITIWGNFLLLLTTEIRLFVVKIRNIKKLIIIYRFPEN